jgi:hypothetical protein
VNALTGVTLLGLIVGFAVGNKPQWSREHGIIFFGHRRWSPRFASAITLGDVVIALRPRFTHLETFPHALLLHEARHARQYPFLLGFPYFPAYWLACGFSWVISGSHAAFNPFERCAGLADGGYPSRRVRWSQKLP